MSETKPQVGSIGWIDLTINDAEGVRDFYASVVGWNHEPVDMGGYADFTMTIPATGTPAAGVCHARGSNEDFPAKWMIYINVADLDASIEQCEKLGGDIIVDPKTMTGHGRYCVIRDPAGATCALFEPAG